MSKLLGSLGAMPSRFAALAQARTVFFQRKPLNPLLQKLTKFPTLNGSLAVINNKAGLSMKYSKEVGKSRLSQSRDIIKSQNGFFAGVKRLKNVVCEI
jgi:hypothetical protein